ncbi:MAG TPA: hypothetical protein VKH81_15880 [Candidatus Angelobacter sp.]|nr:hypothetical protein [Candidatus Angelobacter sp.]
MKKFCIVWVILLSVMTLTAQDTPPAKETAPKKDVQETFKTYDAPTYRLAFNIYELQEGKRTNQRDYNLLVTADGKGPYPKMKIGMKVPLDVGEGKITYTDVGFDLECSAMETTSNKLSVRIELNLSSFAGTDQNADARPVGMRPVIRGISQHVRTSLTPGKPQVITSMDDVNSNKRFQVEVTATKVD